MSSTVVKKLIEVGNTLRDMGTKKEWLVETAQTMAVSAAECTENDPHGSRGWRRYQMGTRRLRETHLPSGAWERDDTDQIASVLNQDRAIRIAVCSTDDGTCIAERGPKNRSKKGAATDRIVDANRQISLFEAFGVEEVISVKAHEVGDDEATTWHLCVYHEGDDLRVELSLFLKTDSGYLDEPVTRIFLLGGEAPPDDALEASGGDESEFDIPVTRKK